MVRISDILKRVKGSKGLGKEGGEKSSPPAGDQKSDEALQGEEKAKPTPWRIASDLLKSAQKAPTPVQEPLIPKRTEFSPPKKEEKPKEGFRFSSLGPFSPKAPEVAKPSAPPPVRKSLFAPVSEEKREREEEGPRRYVFQAIKGSEESRDLTAKGVYQEALDLAGRILQKAQTGDEIRGEEIQKTVEDVIRELTFDNNELIDLACRQIEEEEGGGGFLSAKLVNKTILAITMGIGRKMNKSKLFLLGMTAFFSDLGITKMLDVVSKKEVLTGTDLARIREIPHRTIEILKKIPDLNKVVLTVAQESHERLDGTGPMGIKDLKDLDEFSRIVAVIDVFEALTHDRPHRPRLMPHEAMKKILEEGGKFESDVLRLLIDQIGLYPIGSWVKLTNKEIAKVVGSNPGQPLRPKVKVIFDDWGRQMEEPQSVDLAKNLSIQILQPLSETELQKEMKKG